MTRTSQHRRSRHATPAAPAVADDTSPHKTEPRAPRGLTARVIDTGVDVLLQLSRARENQLNHYPAERLEYDDRHASPSPIYDSFMEARGPAGIRDLTNFSPNEFQVLWAEVEQFVFRKWNAGSCRKSEVTARDMFFMAVSSLKHCRSWDVVAAVFKQKSATFSKRFITTHANKWSMLRLATSGNQFENFPCARYAVDVTFQHCHAPAAGYAERMKFFSKKHALYGLKVEMAVLPNGMVMHVSDAFPAGTHDLVMCQVNLDFHRSQLTKLPDEQHVADRGPLEDEHPNSWALLADKGYQGLARDLRAITPYKQPPTTSAATLTFDQMETNRQIASDRIIVEKIFGRMKSLWTVTACVYTWKRENYDVFLQCAAALTNVHIRFLPLRADDANVYYQYENRIVSIGTRKKRNRAIAQANDRNKRKKRLETLLRDRAAFYDDASGEDHEDASIFD